MYEIITKSENETRAFAEKLGSILSAGDILCISGNLGAGKTVFASGISRGLGISEQISSPTFTIVNEYSGKLPFYHFDAYRINSDEFLDIGGDEYLYSEGVTLIEWPENISDILPKEKLEILINYQDDSSEDFQTRKISLLPCGQRYIERIRQLNLLEEVK
ncbi:MAG: tRNA (adenosine(37)-N6)-threonylcarbamoyltransferase complex ATPase subunit type 1 TsaE [Ignavibacteriales bacterium]